MSVCDWPNMNSLVLVIGANFFSCTHATQHGAYEKFGTKKRKRKRKRSIIEYATLTECWSLVSRVK